MDPQKYKERVLSRFDTVVRYFWDGLPTPPFVCSKDAPSRGSFTIRTLGYSPDYSKETLDIPLEPITNEYLNFQPLSYREPITNSMSARIGSHYSPLVGFFSFKKRSASPTKINYALQRIRIPVEHCEDEAEITKNLHNFAQCIRTNKLVELYEPLVREHSPISQASLKKILTLSTRGMKMNTRESVVSEVCCISDEYVRWESKEIFYYLCINPLVCKILSPLKLQLSPEYYQPRRAESTRDEKEALKLHVALAKKSLKATLSWSGKTHYFFASLHKLWDTRYENLALFDLESVHGSIDSGVFLSHINLTMKTVFTRIRIDFFSSVEELFFAHVPDAKEAVLLNEADLEKSNLHKVFTAVDVYLTKQLRNFIVRELKKLVCFFQCKGVNDMRSGRGIELRKPVLSVSMVIGANCRASLPSFSRLCIGISDLLEELKKEANSLPRVHKSIFRSLNIDTHSMAVVLPMELECFRFMIINSLDKTGQVIDDLSSKYSQYSVVPAQRIPETTKDFPNIVSEVVTLAREHIFAIYCNFANIVYSGCFEIHCRSIKEHFAASWEGYLECFYSQLNASVLNFIMQADAKCLQAQAALQRVPQSVEELRTLLKHTEEVKRLVKSIKVVECDDAILRISKMESNLVPIQPNVYESAMKLMKWPDVLAKQIILSEEGIMKAKPQLAGNLKSLCANTRGYIKTLSTGITELYNMFSFDIRDVAFQTCIELQNLVDQIDLSVKAITSQEALLGIPPTDSFEDFNVLRNHFDIVSQYWAEINRSAQLLGYYKCPIGSLKANQIIEDVRECRRLLHSCTHRLRAYVPLVQLARQQELKLSKFEALEEILYFITIPGLRKHHWKEVSRLLASKLKEDTSQVVDMTAPLHKLLDAGIMDHLKEVSRIALQANNDFLTEEAVEKMKSASKKIFFDFTKATWSHVPRLVVSEECRHSMLLQIEDFFLRSQLLMKNMSLSAPVLNILVEWKGSINKLQKVIVEWNDAEERWSGLCNYMCVLQCKKNGAMDDVRALILEKLTQTDESFKALNEIIKRPQFSLHVAIVQDTISDHVTAAKLTMDEATNMLPLVLDEMREGFPRFNFLTDSQLSSFLSSYDIGSLFSILPFMYPRLCRVTVENDLVTAFTTTNNATISAFGELCLSNDPTEEWMVSFDQVLKLSMASSIKACHDAFFVTDMKTWLTSWCSQFIIMSLRSVHTYGIREAIKNRGVLGLKAHRTKIKNIIAEVQRVALTLGLQPDTKRVVLSALSYLQFADTEIEHALSIGIATISDLDSTPMLQTFITEFAIVTRVMGIVIPYGLEFFGNDREPFFSPQMLEKAISILSLTVGGRSIPLLNHTQDTQGLLQSLCHLCGLFFITVNCSQTTTLDTMRSYLRGALGAGAFFCVSEYRKLSEEIRFFLTESFCRIQNGTLACASASFVTDLGLETRGGFIKTPVHPGFMGVITASEPLHKIARELSQQYRPTYLPRMKLVDMIRVYLDAFGIADESQTASPGFAVIYEHLQEIFPSVFTYPKLLAVLQHAAESVIPKEGYTTDCLFEAFTRIFASVLTENNQLQALLEFYVKHTLGLSASNLRRALSTSPHTKRDMKLEFAKTMSFCHQVIISGPQFSGKTKLWRDFVGTDKHVVLCTSLMTAHEFYEHNVVEGIMKVLAGITATPLERHFVIIEDETFLYATSWINLSLYGRVLGPRKTSFTLNPSSYMIVSTSTLQHTDPHTVCDFTVFSLPAPSDWRSFLRDRLHDAPECDVASGVMEIVLPVVWTAVEHGDCNRVDEDVLNTNMGFYATCKQCMKLYIRWYSYIVQAFCSPTSSVREEVADPQLNEHIFVARCAVQAVCWSMGLALDPCQLDHIRRALLTVEDNLNEFMENYNSTEKILPPVVDGENILEFVVTRSGWELLSEAISHINDLSWSEYTKIDPQSEASSQRFPTPSRLSTLRAIECLINCGQHVLILGACGSGKSSLLRSTRLCERWFQHFVNCSKGFSPIQTQNQLVSQLLPRSTSTFGPPLGSKLVVCIDDMHLSSSAQADAPIASSLVLFYDKYSAICTPTVGFIPATDLVYVGTALEAFRNPSVQCAFINVYLPPMQGSELVNGIWRLLETTCGKRRTDGFPRECTSFIILAYMAVERAIAGSSVIASRLRNGNDGDSSKAAPWVSLGGLSLSDTIFSQLGGQIMETESILSQHFSLAFHGVEIARRQLSSGISDLQVAVNLFIGVERLYVGHYAGDANRENLRQDISQCAQATLGKCLGDNKFLAAVKQGACDELYSPSKRQACVLKWLEDIHAYLSEAVVQPLSEMDLHTSNHSLENEHVDTSTDLYSNRGQLSVCVTTANSSTVGSLIQNAPFISSTFRELSQRQSKYNKNASLSEEQLRLSLGQKWKVEATTFITVERVNTIASIVTQSKCIAENAFELVQAVKHTGSPLHTVILCNSVFEIISLTFMVIVATRFPVVLIRPYRGYYSTGKEAKYDFDTFVADMKALVRYAYGNNVRMVVVIPNTVLAIPLVLRQIDLLIRAGDLREIFSRGELWSLVHGNSTLCSKQWASRGAMGVLSPSEEEALYAYIRQCFTFILQVYSESHLLNSLKSGSYRCFADMRILQGLDTEELVSMRRGMVYSIISKRSEKHNGIAEPNYYRCGCQELADLVYTFYETSQEFFPDTREDRFSDFASLVTHIERICAEKTRDSAVIATVLVDRGDVVTKVIKNNAQLTSQAAEELDRLREDIVELKKKLERESIYLEYCNEDFQKIQKDVQEGALELSKLESVQDTSLTKAKEMVQESAVLLKKIKPQTIQMLSKSLSSKKLILLIRAVYGVLGEEIPKEANHPNELWVVGMRRMSAPGFVQSIISASTQHVADPATLLLLERDLKKNEFGKSSACAQLLVNYILAFIRKLRVQQAKVEDRNTYSIQRKSNQEAEERLRQCSCRVSETSEEIRTIKENIKQMEDKCCEVQERQRLCIERGKQLFSYLNSMDCFTRFAAPAEDIDEQVRRANCAQGDTLLIAAYNFFLSVHYPNDTLYKKLQNILHDHGVPFTDGPEVPARELLFCNHGALIDLIISRDLPFRHRCALYNLHHRIARRWHLFGGVCEVFNDTLKEYLLFTCNGFMVVSALDNNAKKALIQAMRAGSGVLLYNLETDPTSTELIVALFPLFGKLDIEWENCRLGTHARGSAANGATKSKGIPFCVFGQNIEVNPKFNLICVSVALIRPYHDRESLGTTIFDYVSLTNFFEPIPLSVRISHNLLHSQGMLKNVQEELHKRRRRVFSEVTAFIEKHDHSSKLLSADLEHITNCGKHELDMLDEILKDANAHDGQIATLKVQLQMIHKQITEAWLSIEASLKQCAELLQFIEADKLGRSWDDRVIDPFLSCATCIVPHVGTRFASLRFKDHSLAQKQLCAVVNFVDNIVPCFSCGWPLPVRGLFSMLILHGALLASSTISSYLGTAFPTLEILNLAQFNALLSILGKDSKHSVIDFPLSFPFPKHGGNAEETATESVKKLISKAYLDSGDAQLKRIASENVDAIENSTSSTESTSSSLVPNFFQFLQNLDFPRCEDTALRLYATTLEVLKNSDSNPPEPRSQRSGHKPTEMAHSTAQEIPRASYNNSLVDCRSSTSSFSRAPPSIGSCNLPLLSVHSRELLWEHNAKHYIPLYMVSRNPYATLYDIQHEAVVGNWLYEQHEVVGLHAETNMLAIHIAKCLLRPHMMDNLKGFWFGLLVDLSSPRTKKAIGENTKINYGECLVESIHKILATYIGWHSLVTGDNESYTNRVSVRFVLVCTPESHRLLWKGTHELRPGRCLHICDEHTTPQRHLLHLLQGKMLQKMLVQRGDQSSSRALSPNSPHQPQGRSAMSPGTGAVLTAQGSGTILFTDSRTGRRFPREAQELPMRGAAGPVWRILIKELCFMHIGLSGRHRLLKDLKRTPQKHFPLWQSHIF